MPDPTYGNKSALQILLDSYLGSMSKRDEELGNIGLGSQLPRPNLGPSSDLGEIGLSSPMPNLSSPGGGGGFSINIPGIGNVGSIGGSAQNQNSPMKPPETYHQPSGAVGGTSTGGAGAPQSTGTGMNSQDMTTEILMAMANGQAVRDQNGNIIADFSNIPVESRAAAAAALQSANAQSPTTPNGQPNPMQNTIPPNPNAVDSGKYGYYYPPIPITSPNDKYFDQMMGINRQGTNIDPEMLSQIYGSTPPNNNTPPFPQRQPLVYPNNYPGRF